MGSGKMSSRQKMINMMYLVLTAMLALNVSREVLKSFHIMEQGFTQVSDQLDSRRGDLVSSFKTNLDKDKTKTEPFFERAQEAMRISAEFNEYIDGIKVEMEELHGGRMDLVDGDQFGEIKGGDQMEKHANYFVNKKHGIELQNKINETRKKLLDLLKPDETVHWYNNPYLEASASAQLSALDPERGSRDDEKKTWVSVYLEHNPIAGVMAMLSKIKNDAKTLELDVLSKLHQGINDEDISFNNLEARVIPKSNFVMAGTPYEAEILLVASNTTTDHNMLVNGSRINVKDGAGYYTKTSNEIGLRKFSGSIMVKGADGVEKPYDFKSEYTIFKPVATVSADKMNVLYVGLENPISVSVPGFTSDKVVATISGGNWRLTSKGNGKYIATGERGVRTVTVNISVRTEDGVRSMGSQKYRIRTVPLPKVKLGTLDGSRAVSLGEVKRMRRVIASLGNSFVFENVKYTMLSYTLHTYSRSGLTTKHVQGADFTRVRSEVNHLRRGDNIMISKVRVRGPEGVKEITGLALMIK
jgi:gliding motility-associated protein GldM